MRLRHIERGARLQIVVKSGNESEYESYEALFHDMHDLINETSIVVQCPKLNKNYMRLDRNAVLEVNFAIGPNVYTFEGRAVGKMYSDMVIIEQTTEIEELNRRRYQRDEIRVEVRVYGLPEDRINESRYARPGIRPVLADMSFDISSGGMCIVTNMNLNSEHDPYYLVEFSISEKDSFMLPAKLVRRSNFARSRVGKFDYGLEFLYNNMPDEMSRLTKAILNKKLSFLTS